MSTFYHERISNASGIYRITCTITGKFYIGSALNLRIRRKCHFRDLQKGIHTNPKLQHAWNKYGPDAFLFEVLELVLPISLTAREQYWFDRLKPWGNRGFNIVRIAGSCLGRECSPATRAKIGAARLGKPNPHPGYKVTPETRARMSKAHMGNTSTLGHTLSAEHRAKIVHTKTFIVTAPDGTEYMVHGLKKFCEEHALSDSPLIQVAKGKQRHHKGWKARYPETGAS